jgi:hypothetical protein
MWQQLKTRKNKTFRHEPKQGLDTKTDRMTEGQFEADFDVDFEKA